MPIDSPPDVSAAAQPGPRSSRWLIVLVAVGLALRIGVQLVKGQDLHSDPDAYVAHAQTLLQTGTFCVPATNRPTAFRPPVYPILLAVVRLIGLSAPVAVALVNLAASAAMIVGTWWLARVIGLRGKWPTICGALVAFDPLLLRYAALPMTEVTAGGFLTVAVLLAVKGISTEQDPTPRWKSAATAGLCFGIGGLCRPILFVACAAVSAGLLLHAILRWPKERSTMENLQPVFLPAVLAALVLSLWIVRNALQLGHFVPATTHGGYTLLLGNNPVFYREVVNGPARVWGDASLRAWQQETADWLAAEQIPATDEVATDTALSQLAWSHINADPTSFRQACLLRWRRFWAVAPESTSNDSSGIAGWISGIWYVPVFAGLIAAFCTMTIRRDSRLLLLFLPILAFFAMHTIYWTNARMRAPLSAVIAVLSIVGWQTLMKWRSTAASDDSAANRT
ncbi:MAG: hypothetical protein NXI04_04355 [Planctomycetaceae bacterium]|nr:hypothetical protein [Planctomycetaceae bacterium]